MRDTSPEVGKVLLIAPGLRRIIAPNPSPMTYWGTNTFILGREVVAIIDPGPQERSHLNAILGAVQGATVTSIILTHSHLDHSPLARELANETNAKVLAFGDSFTGKSELMRNLEAKGLSGGGEGIDRNFQPDRCLKDGELIFSSEWELRVHHTPGHMGNHIALQWEDAVFTGDLVMGWASTMVSPPDGDLSDFFSSCERLKALEPKILYPAHGDQIDDPGARIAWLIDHRKERTTQILSALKLAPSDVETLTRIIYTDAPKGLLAAAARNVFAHLIHLHQRGVLEASPELGPNAVYALK